MSKLMIRFRETGSLMVLEKKKQGPNFRFTRKQEEKLGKIVSSTTCFWHPHPTAAGHLAFSDGLLKWALFG